MRLTICQSHFPFFAILCCAIWCAGHAEVAAQEAAVLQAAPQFPEIKRLLPPEGIAIPADIEKRLRGELEAAYQRYEPLKKHELAADIEVFLKAVRYALDLREFYTDKDFAKADTLLKEANERIKQLAAGKHPWTTATGTVVRGYRSTIDDSAQPYGVVIPKNFDFKQKVPLYIWLHGRGDKATDLHFIVERMSKPGEITPPNAIVVHAFGRQCVGFLNAGEVDVIDVMREGEVQYKTDPDRRVLIGFSMGGAGAWHVGAHYAHLFRVIAPGAGFAETARYQKLKPEDYPPWYEQKLWGQNDSPAYVRNLFNTEVIAYSGELDRQIQAARVMEEAYQAEGKTLTHLIGPKTEHKYEPATKAELLKRIDAALQGPSPTGDKFTWQSRTLRYTPNRWIQLFQLEEHWQDSRVDFSFSDGAVQIKTKNIAELSISAPDRKFAGLKEVKLTIDGQNLTFSPALDNRGNVLGYTLAKNKGEWRQIAPLQTALNKKTPGVQGPIDDAFCSRFLVVTPTGRSQNPKFQAWQEAELAHFRNRWLALMRGDLLVKKDTEVTADDIEKSNLILWGDENSNSIIKKVADKLPIKRSGSQWTAGGAKYDSSTHVPVMIYPNPLDSGFPKKYIVLNSGLTFREAHDRTNSLQNPKLPDWAIIDITQPPDGSTPGKVVNAGFFDEEWNLQSRP